MFYIRILCLIFLSSFSWIEATPFSETIHLEKNSRAGYLSLSRESPINNTTYIYVKYALEFFRKEGVSFVLLDLDTPGGEVFAALNIVQELKKMDAEYKIPVVAFVDNWALSAGALLAYSCRFIGATSQASMGAAEPVMVGQDGKMETASEKMVSALRTEFAKTAELYGRDPLVAAAMCDKDIVLVERSGKIISLLSDDQIEKEDIVINAKGKLLTLNAQQMQKLCVADFIVAESPIGPLSGKMILSEEPFFSSPIEWISYSNWKIDFFAFLSHPFVSSLLIFGLMIGIYGELQNPGFGFSAILGLSCLSLILLSSFATQLVSSLEVIFLFGGLIFVIIDVFLVGSGILCGIGIFLALAGLFSVLLPSLAGTSFSWKNFEESFIWSEWIYRLSLFLFTLFFSAAFCSILGRIFFQRGFIGKRLVLQNSQTSFENVEEMPKIGAKGQSFSSLRPLGKVLIDGKLYEAETEGEFMKQGACLEVIGLKGRVLLVREAL